MAKKKKEKVSIIEEVQFKDLEHAKRAVTLAKINQIRILIGFVFALISTACTLIAIFGNVKDVGTLIGAALVLAFPAYIIGGGIGKALKVAWKITKIGWFLIPFFPADILFAIAFFIFSVFGLCFVSVIFVGINYVQHKKTLDSAKSYLAQCGYVAEAAAPAEE